MDVKVYNDTEVFDISGDCMKDKQYEKYAPFDVNSDIISDTEKAIMFHLDWFFHSMDHSKDGLLRIKLGDLATINGMKMQQVVDGKVVEGSPGIDPIYVELVLNYVLFHNGIVSDVGELEDKQPVIIMRRRVDGDVLPSIFCGE